MGRKGVGFRKARKKIRKETGREIFTLRERRLTFHSVSIHVTRSTYCIIGINIKNKNKYLRSTDMQMLVRYTIL